MTQAIPQTLLELKTSVFEPCGFHCSGIEAEKESQDYSAHSFQLNELAVRYRESKITPTKTGQFVTLWKRIEAGPIQPFDVSDPIDLFLIYTGNHTQSGLFIFPKTILHEKNILSGKDKEGKRGFRVYPVWDLTTNIQAKKTQLWQLGYFLELSNGSAFNKARALQLLSNS